jgi:hypothetical protein
MKTIKLLAVMLFVSGFAFGQDINSSEVPPAVASSFEKEFPKARDVQWELKGEEYNVEFEIGFFTDYEAWFDNTGKLIRVEQEISDGDLPQAVIDVIKSQYAGYRVDDAEKITENGRVSYKVEIEKKEDERKLVFSEDGKLL